MRTPVKQPVELEPAPPDASASALLAVLAAVQPLDLDEQERVLNAACAFFGHHPVERPGAIERGE